MSVCVPRGEMQAFGAVCCASEHSELSVTASLAVCVCVCEGLVCASIHQEHTHTH